MSIDGCNSDHLIANEIDCIARYEVVESVRISEFKQGTYAEGGWIENGKGYIVHYCIDANCYGKRDPRQTIIALLIFLLLLFSIVDFVMLIFCGSNVILSVASSHAVMGETARTEQGFEQHALKHGLMEGESENTMSSGRRISVTNIRDSKDYLSVLEMKDYASVTGILLYHDLDRPDLQFAMGQLMTEVVEPQRKQLRMMKHCVRNMTGERRCAWECDIPERFYELVILTDTDRNSDSERRMCVDWVHNYHSGHLIESSMSTQQVASFSTAENELYGIVRGVTSGTQFHETFMQFGFLVRFWILSDYSVARNIAARIGSGQLKRLEDQIWMYDGKNSSWWRVLILSATWLTCARSFTPVRVSGYRLRS